MFRRRNRIEPADVLEVERASEKRNAIQALFYLFIFAGLAIAFHFGFRGMLPDTHSSGLSESTLTELEIKVFLLRELLSLLAAALVTFVAGSLHGVFMLWRLQNKTIRNSTELSQKFDRLEMRFTDMQTRDNIIVPASDHRILSVATLRGLPMPIKVDWERELKESLTDDDIKNLHGCTMLFWPSIDDVINSWDYVKYFSAMSRLDFFRILVTPRPKPEHEEGLKVYLELARYFSTKTYVVDQEKWYGEIAAHFAAPATRPRSGLLRHFQKEEDVTAAKLRVRELLESQIDIVTTVPLTEFRADSESKWLVRYLESNGLRCVHDQRMNLARRDIVCISSASATDARTRREVDDIVSVMLAMRSFPDATIERAADSVESLFSTAFPSQLRDSIDQIGMVRAS